MPDTNWVFDNFNLIQESGGNIQTQEGLNISLQEFDNTNWQWLKKYLT
jgi:hypothetical protein